MKHTSTPDLVRLTMDRDPEVRLEACQQLAGRGIPTTCAVLRPLMDDPDPAVRVAAARALGAVRGPGTRSFLRSRCVDDDPDVQRAVGEALDGLEVDRAEPGPPPGRPGPERLCECRTQVESGEPRLRAMALADLARSDEPDVVGLLQAALDDPSPMVRAAAVQGLGRYGPGRALERLLELTEDDSPEVRRAAASTLGRHRAGAAFASVAVLLGDDFQSVREAAAGALVRLGGDRVADELRAAARSWVPGSVCVLDALEEVGGRVTGEVAAWLEHPFEGVRAVALEWVTRRREARLREEVERLLDDDEPWIADLARQALSVLGVR